MKHMTHKWWAFGLRGLFAVIFGVVAVLVPTQTLKLLIFLFGSYALADGLIATWSGLGSTSRKDQMRASLVEGIIGLMIGISALMVPQITELALVYLVATWAFLTGLFEFFAFDETDHVMLNTWPYVLFGLVSMAAGGVLAMFPMVGASLLMLLLGSYSLVFGLISLQLAWRLYVHHRHMHAPVDLHHAKPTR